MGETAAAPGFLSSIFNWESILKFALISIPLALMGQMIMDPIFFQPIHDMLNTSAQAWVMFVNDYLGWIPTMLGIGKTPGLLSGPMDALLGSRKKLLELPSTETITNVLPDDLSFESLLAPAMGM